MKTILKMFVSLSEEVIVIDHEYACNIKLWLLIGKPFWF